MGPGLVDILRFIGATLGLILGPVLASVLFGFLQLGAYKLLVKLGLIKNEDIPMFPILIMRGLFIILAVIAIVVFYLRFGLKEPGFTVNPPQTSESSGAAPTH